MARLEIIEGEHTGKSFIFRDEIVLGRGLLETSTDTLVCLPDKRISRQHARITRMGWIFLLEDLGSANGTVLRGDMIQSKVAHDLYDRDEFWLSSFRLAFHAELDPLTAQRPGHDKPLAGMRDAGAAAAALGGECGTLSIMVATEDVFQPTVSVWLDASHLLPEHGANASPTAQEVQSALKRLQAMAQVSTALGVVLDQKPLMQKIIDCLFDIFPTVDRAFILLQSQGSTELVPVAAKQRSQTPDAGAEVVISRAIVQEVMTHKRSLVSLDTRRDARFNTHESIISSPTRSVMCAPLLVGQEVLGLIQVDTSIHQQAFTADDLAVLTGIGAQAAIAVKNAQLYEAIEVETARRTSLQRYFSPNLVEMLMSGDVSTELGGSAYWGTILFADIIGFTTMSEMMAPIEVVSRLNRCFTIMQRAIYTHGGNVDKFGGDDVMAFWGVPRCGEEDEGDAVRAALQMQAQLWAFNLDLEGEGHNPVHMGIGLNTGEFVAGNIGSQDKIEFTVIGDHVNLAARIVKLAARYQVFVSEATWQPIKHLVCAIQLPPTTVKGKTQPVPVYSIRAIQQRTRKAHSLALLCYLLDAMGYCVGRGIITESADSQAGLRLFFSTDATLMPDQLLTLLPVMLEYHQTLTFTARVESCVTNAYDGETAYTKAILTVIEGDAFAAFLTLGSCLVTSHTWEYLVRV